MRRKCYRPLTIHRRSLTEHPRPWSAKKVKGHHHLWLKHVFKTEFDILNWVSIISQELILQVGPVHRTDPCLHLWLKRWKHFNVSLVHLGFKDTLHKTSLSFNTCEYVGYGLRQPNTREWEKLATCMWQTEESTLFHSDTVSEIPRTRAGRTLILSNQRLPRKREGENDMTTFSSSKAKGFLPFRSVHSAFQI